MFKAHINKKRFLFVFILLVPFLSINNVFIFLQSIDLITPDTGLLALKIKNIHPATVWAKVNASHANDVAQVEDTGDKDFQIYNGSELKWSYDASATIKWFDRWEDGFATGDLNDDGIADVVIGTIAGDVIAVNGASGQQLWKYTIDNTTEYVNADIVDIDEDGSLDVVAGGKVTNGNVKIVKLEKDGSLEWTATGDYPEVTDFAFGDVNNDGFKDVVTSIGKYPFAGGQVVLFDGRDGTRIWEKNLGSGIAFAIDAKDINGDGDMEVAVTNYDNKVFLIDGKTNTIEWSKSGVYYGRDVIIEDINKDSNYEIFAVLGNAYCYDPSGILDWSITTGVGENLKVWDMNNDGKDELFISDPWNGKTSLVNAENGEILLTRSEAGAADMGDFNGDGVYEIITASLKWYDPDFSSQHLRVYDIQNNMLWESVLDAEPSAILVANLDTDPQDEALYTIDSRLYAIDVELIPVRVETVENTSLPSGYKLLQNYPNPFNPETTIEYFLPQATHVRLFIYNSDGQRITTLVDQYQSTGLVSIKWNGRDEKGLNVSSGVYFYKLETRDFVHVKKLVLLQ